MKYQKPVAACQRLWLLKQGNHPGHSMQFNEDYFFPLLHETSFLIEQFFEYIDRPQRDDSAFTFNQSVLWKNSIAIASFFFIESYITEKTVDIFNMPIIAAMIQKIWHWLSLFIPEGLLGAPQWITTKISERLNIGAREYARLTGLLIGVYRMTGNIMLRNVFLISQPIIAAFAWHIPLLLLGEKNKIVSCLAATAMLAAANGSIIMLNYYFQTLGMPIGVSEIRFNQLDGLLLGTIFLYGFSGSIYHLINRILLHKGSTLLLNGMKKMAERFNMPLRLQTEKGINAVLELSALQTLWLLNDLDLLKIFFNLHHPFSKQISAMQIFKSFIYDFDLTCKVRTSYETIVQGKVVLRTEYTHNEQYGMADIEVLLKEQSEDLQCAELNVIIEGQYFNKTDSNEMKALQKIGFFSSHTKVKACINQKILYAESTAEAPIVESIKMVTAQHP